MNRTLVLRILLAYAAAAHLLIGIAAIVVPPGDLADVIVDFAYGGAFEIGEQMRHVLRILGVFMTAVGVMTVFAAFDPRRHVAVIYTLALIFVIRTAQRIIWADEIRAGFDISTGRLVTQSVLMLALGALLLYLRPRKELPA